MVKAAQNGNGPQYSFRDFFYLLFRHKWKIIFFFLAVTITVTLGTFLAEEIYRSEAKLMVLIGRETVSLDPTATTGQVISGGLGQSREIEINSEMEILKSRELAEKVVDAVGPKAILEGGEARTDKGTLTPIHEKLREILGLVKGVRKNLESYFTNLRLVKPVTDRDQAIINFTQNFTAETQKANNILFLSYEGPGVGLSQDILAKLINFYLEKHIVAHRTSGSYQFFNKQSDQFRNQVNRVEEELKELKSKTGVSSLDEQRRILMNRAGSLQQESEATQAAVAISRAKVKELKGKLAGLSPILVTQETKGTANNAADLMRSRLYELQLKEQELLSKYTPNSIPVKEIRRQIGEAQALLAKEEPTRTQVTTGINTAYQELNLDLIKETANLSSLEAKIRVLDSQQEAARLELAQLNNTEVRMVGLQRELSLLEGKYRKYAENLEQTRIDQALLNNRISNISVVQAPMSFPQPVRPRKALNIALGIFLGVFGGIALAFFSEYLDHSLKTPKDVEEKLNLPSLASIPVLKK
jgi:uncharacterized protein involved in exopolysaccharide biosynthesis